MKVVSTKVEYKFRTNSGFEFAVCRIPLRLTSWETCWKYFRPFSGRGLIYQNVYEQVNWALNLSSKSTVFYSVESARAIYVADLGRCYGDQHLPGLIPGLQSLSWFQGSWAGAKFWSLNLTQLSQTTFFATEDGVGHRLNLTQKLVLSPILKRVHSLREQQVSGDQQELRTLFSDSICQHSLDFPPNIAYLWFKEKIIWSWIAW